MFNAFIIVFLSAFNFEWCFCQPAEELKLIGSLINVAGVGESRPNQTTNIRVSFQLLTITKVVCIYVFLT